jgi:1-acyl-sn-glycerol-3-phosphate acyltransferase
VTRADLPASADEHPATRLLHLLRPPATRLVRTRWPVQVHHADRVPATGGAILASNHIGIIDGPLLAVFSPRPVHALTKQEMFEGRLGRLLHASGQIPLDRFHADPGAIRSCLRVVRDGGVAGIFPEGTRGSGELHRFHHGAAYLALVTGAPVVPVTMLGTRPAGGGSNTLPGSVADDTAGLAPHPGTRGGHVGVAPGAPAVRAGHRAQRHAPILARAASCGTIRGRPRHRARRAIQRAVIHHD